MVTVTQVSELIAQLSGLAIFAGTLAAIGAFVYRWYVREEIPRGLALLVGLSGVAVYLNTTTALGQVIGGSSAPTEIEVALFNIVAFLAGAGGATLGHWAGDWFGMELFLNKGVDDRESDVGRLVQSVGRVIAVELPADIDDVVGYDPVPAETKETLAGKTFMFPRRLTVDELRSRLVTRLKTDYGVGHIDIELAADGTVEYLALGSRAAGIGPTLPPATNAVAIRADPAFAASAGDLVQVWETDPMRRVLTAELRGVSEDTVTIAIDAADTQKIDPTTEYRLVTLPVEDRPDREFASLLRAADETFTSVTVEAGSPLHGLPIAALDVLVVAVKPEAEKPQALADPSTILTPGDVVFAIARPDALRRLEATGKPLDPSLVSDPSTPQRSATPEDSGDPAPPTADDSRESETGATATDSETAVGTTTETDQPAEPADGTDAEQADEPASADDESKTADFDPPAAADSDESDESDETTAGKADESSFQQLKAEFDSGDADWAEGKPANGDQSTEPEDATASDSSDETADSAADEGGLDDALAEAGEDLAGPDSSGDASEDDDLDGLSFDDESDDGLADDDSLDFGDDDAKTGSDDLDSLSFEDEAEDNDLSSLSFDEDEDEELSFDDAEDEEDDDEDSDDEEENDDDDDDDDSGGGGASSFQQLKEEFDSGDADWEDDVSDSPGGDMRLDE